MTSDPKLDLLGVLFALQEEEGDFFDLPTARIEAIAAGERPSGDEEAILLASPLAREELALARRLRAVHLEEFWRNRGANDNDAFVLRSRLAAAESGLNEEIEIASAAGIAVVRRGPSARVPFLLTLTLDPAWWEGLHRACPVVVREVGPDGLIWLRGTTDQAGVDGGSGRTTVRSARRRRGSRCCAGSSGRRRRRASSFRGPESDYLSA